jgi:hypothetical protein
VRRDLTRAAQPSIVHLVVQVWGEIYTGLLIDLCIPALLSPGNLPALAALLPCRFDIYTTDRDEAQIRRAPILLELERFAKVRYIRLEIETSQNKYAVMTECNIRALREASSCDAAIVFLVPDTIWSDGTLETVARALAAGKRAVMQTGVRVIADTAVPAIVAACPPDERGILTVPARMLVRSFEAISKEIVFDYATVDGNTLLRIFPDPAEFGSLKVIQDTREGLMMDLAYTYEEYPVPEIEFEVDNLLKHTNLLGPNHYWHFLHPIEYRCEREISHIGSYERQPDGSLRRLEIAVSSAIRVHDTDIETFLRVRLPKEFAAIESAPTS